MQVVKVSFRLESSIFKLNDLIDIGLEKHKREIEEICLSAKKEQELESKMRSIEEEWNEQVLSFNSYKDYGEICLDKRYTEELLEQLEDAQESLANMLTSRYVGPLRGEVASWSEKVIHIRLSTFKISYILYKYVIILSSRQFARYWSFGSRCKTCG